MALPRSYSHYSLSRHFILSRLIIPSFLSRRTISLQYVNPAYRSTRRRMGQTGIVDSGFADSQVDEICSSFLCRHHSNALRVEYRQKSEIRNVRNGKFQYVTRHISRGPIVLTFSIITQDLRPGIFSVYSLANRRHHSNAIRLEYRRKAEISNVRKGKFQCVT